MRRMRRRTGVRPSPIIHQPQQYQPNLPTPHIARGFVDHPSTSLLIASSHITTSVGVHGHLLIHACMMQAPITDDHQPSLDVYDANAWRDHYHLLVCVHNSAVTRASGEGMSGAHTHHYHHHRHQQRHEPSMHCAQWGTCRIAISNRSGRSFHTCLPLSPHPTCTVIIRQKSGLMVGVRRGRRGGRMSSWVTYRVAGDTASSIEPSNDIC